MLTSDDHGYEQLNEDAEAIRRKINAKKDEINEKRKELEQNKEELGDLKQEYRRAMGLEDDAVMTSDISPMFPATAEYLTGAVRDPVDKIEGGRKTRKKRQSYKKKSKKLRRTRRRHSYKKKSKKLRSTRRRRR